jgi:hypothetical protein
VGGAPSDYGVFSILPMRMPEESEFTVAEESRMPEFEWSSVSGARKYYVEIERSQRGRWKRYRSIWVDHVLHESVQRWVADDSGGLHSATYRWRVRAWNDEGYGDWSDYAPEFVIDVGTPEGVATPLAPVGGAVVTEAYPQFTWSPVTNATGYYLKLFRNGRAYRLKQNGRNVSQAWSGTTNYVPEVALPTGDYQWWVRAWNPDGFSPDGYSDPAAFTLTE